MDNIKVRNSKTGIAYILKCISTTLAMGNEEKT